MNKEPNIKNRIQQVIKIVKQLDTRIIMEEVSLMDNPSITVKAILEKTPNPSVQSYLKHGFN